MTVPVPEQSTTARWLDLLYRGVDGLLTLFTFDHAEGVRETLWAPNAAELACLAHGAARGRKSIWHGVATRRQRLAKGRGAAADCLWLPALYADVDVEGPGHTTAGLPPTFTDAHALINDFPCPPTAIVNTGGGLQPWWVLAEPLEAGEAAKFLDRWGATWIELGRRRGWHVDNVFDLARIMRVPGTWNHKTVPPLPVIIEALEPNRLYGLDDLDQWTIEPPAPEAPPRATGTAYIGPERPGDAYNARHTGDDVLLAQGFAFDHTDYEGNRHYRAPHRAQNKNDVCGATVYADDGHTTIWSETVASRTGAAVRRPYDPFGLYTALVHRGRFTDAQQALRGLGYGGTSVRIEDIVDTPTPTAERADEFWTSRPELEHIHRAALAALVSPWALLGVTLARVIAATPPSVTLPPIVGSKASLNIAIGLVGPSGSGKGAATSVAEQTFEIGLLEDVPMHTIGSGQGLAHAYAHWDGKLQMVSREGHPDAVILLVEEVDHLAGQAQMRGSTMLAELRRVLMGERLGHLYADRSRRIEVPAHTYRASLIVGIQPARAGVLLGDIDGGTPQRFLWLPTVYPHPDNQPAAPTALRWSLPPLRDGGQHIGIPERAAQEIRQSRLERSRGKGDPLDGHRLLLHEKVAAAFALLARRLDVTDDDWDLASVVMKVSDETREHAGAVLRERAREANVARGKADSERAITAEDATHTTRVQRAAQGILRRLAGADWVAHAAVRGSLYSQLRNYFEDALEHLIAAGSVEVRTTENGQGNEYREHPR